VADFFVNGQHVFVEAQTDTPLLWIIKAILRAAAEA
jgi:hypothetical protein